MKSIELMKKHFQIDERAVMSATSLLVCSRNRPTLLLETIQSILQGNEIPMEIVIVDQSDVPHPILADMETGSLCVIHYVWSETRGVSQARNTAISMASHPNLIFTDDDMLVTPTWFGSLVRSLLERGPQSVITGRVLSSDDDHFQAQAPSTRTDEQTIVYKGRIARDVLFTGSMAIDRSALKSIGCFDTNFGPGTAFPAAEDNDLAFRLLEAGYQIVYDPGAVIYHRAWRSRNEDLRLHWNYGLGQGAFYAKHFKLSDPFMIKRMIGDIFAYGLRLPLRLFMDPKQAHRDMLFVAGMLCGGAQRQIQRISRRRD